MYGMIFYLVQCESLCRIPVFSPLTGCDRLVIRAKNHDGGNYAESSGLSTAAGKGGAGGPGVASQVHPLMTEEMGVDIDARLSMRHRAAEGLVVFTSHAWRRLYDIKGPLVRELMLEFFSTCRFDDMVLDLVTNGVLRTVTSKGDLRGYWEEISSFGDFFTTVPSYLLIRDPLRRLYHCLIAHTIARRGHALEKVTSTDLLLPEESLQGTTIVGMELGEIELDELARLHISESAAHAKEEARLQDEVHRIHVSLGEQCEVVDVVAGDLSRTSLEKKSTELVKYRSSGILCVL
ncbi:hypothetical protein Tco_0924839 [Tanacetum coccineum]|uniref:Uncharacterized protein n=1 Tax=Tanacetum coccineum TaxID=301880 RepID=A0ABQ5D6F5_9ASTR